MTQPPPQPDVSDEDLARRAQGGCADSFEQLTRRFQVPLLRFLGRRVASQADAEDLLQETFVRVWRRLGTFQAERRFSTWLFTIAYRLAVSHHRARRSEESARSSAGAMRDLADRAGAPPDPADAAAGRECGHRLWDVAARVLSEEQFTAVWLYYVEGMDTRDLTGVLGKSWVAVKTMLFRARARLMPYLAEWADGEAVPPPRRQAKAPREESDDESDNESDTGPGLFAGFARGATPAVAEARP